MMDNFLRSFLVLLLTVTTSHSTQSQDNIVDPLTSLTPEEIHATSMIIKKSYVGSSENLVFVTISRVEPPKNILASFLRQKLLNETTENHNLIPRKSLTILMVLPIYKSFRIVVNLNNKKLESVEYLGQNVQPLITSVDRSAVKEAIWNNQTIINRLTKIGLDLNRVNIITSASSFFDDPFYSKRRILQAFFSFSMFENDNNFAHPLDFVAFVDVASKKVIHILQVPIYANQTLSSDPEEQILTSSNIPTESSNYSPWILPQSFYRKSLPLLYTTSNGNPGFKVDLISSRVAWDKYRFQYSFDPKEGLVLHDISYDKRSLIYRASHGDMIVPYMDPRSPWVHKHPIDQGEYGLGLLANSILPNSECYSDGQLIDMYVNNVDGSPRLIRGAICIHEKVDGLLHKHTDSGVSSDTKMGPGPTTSASLARILNIFFVATVGNYDYNFSWKFHQDGSIGMEIGMTGLVFTTLTLDGQTPYGSLVFPKVNALYHQHIFNVRLDVDFDGESNSVLMDDIVPVLDQGIQILSTPLTTSLNSVTDTQASTDRTWKIINPNSLNPITKKPVSWKLVPMNKPLLLASPNSRIYKRGTFGTHSVWVTKYNDGELYPAGEFPNQSMDSENDGLPKWVGRNDSIIDTDIVLWHSFGSTHIPRTEDFPIMAFEKVGFKLKPVNFFSSYPGLDIPPVV